MVDSFKSYVVIRLLLCPIARRRPLLTATPPGFAQCQANPLYTCPSQTHRLCLGLLRVLIKYGIFGADSADYNSKTL